jgi:hypothetical protein
MSQYARNLSTYLVGALHPEDEETLIFGDEEIIDADDNTWLHFEYKGRKGWACVNEMGEVEVEDDHP